MLVVVVVVVVVVVLVVVVVVGHAHADEGPATILSGYELACIVQLELQHLLELKHAHLVEILGALFGRLKVLGAGTRGCCRFRFC